jgi:hypothetical protein
MSAVKGLQTKDERYKTMSTHSPSKDCNMFSLSQFQQLLKPISQGTFNKMVEQHQSDKHNKGFSSWQHLIAMVYAQVSSSTS